MSTPQIPPRPVRSQQQQQQQQIAMEAPDMPKIPPRPARRDRTQSPNRDSFPRSPLNEVPSATNLDNKPPVMYSNTSQDASSSSLSLPHRPPSVSLPSIGQEGNEYADIHHVETEGDDLEIFGSNEPTQTRNVGSDLPLHAPRPSFSNSTAKARVSGVTRTDSVQAAAAGIGKALTPSSGDDKDPHSRSLQSRASRGSLSRPESSTSTERPGSGQAGDGDHGIPEIPGIGQRVPMYPDAGDVQAPTPSPFSQTFPSGIGFHNQGSKPRHHGRTRSGREVFHGPPGSYGLHGHGPAANADHFERAWYDKHPEALEREGHGQYGPGISGGRGEWALSSEDLNKIVRDTASRGSGFGTSPGVSGLPNEQFGYMASEEYVSRLNTPQSATYLNKAHSNHSQPHVESPLRKASFPIDVEGKDTFDQLKGSHVSARTGSSENALESETEDEGVHVNAPAIRKDKITGNGYDPPTEDLGPHGGNTEAQGGWIEETGYGVPILASDEVAKESGTEYLQPAVSPAQSRRGSQYYAGMDSEAPPSYQSGFKNSSRSGSASNSRPTSRPGSIHGTLPNLARFASLDDREDMHTPLEDVDEYEPLFPDEGSKEGRPLPASERFKRREMKRFPSQDIWEDTPNSLQLQATVNTPEPIEPQATDAAKPSTTFESPEAEKARKGEVSEQEKAKLIPKEERLAKSNFKPHLRNEMHRPGLKQRFPSRDIWEDSPDSARLETTVGGPQDDDLKSPPDEGLRAGAVVSTSGRPDEGILAGEQLREGTTTGAAAMKPSVPPRPPRGKLGGDSSDAGTQAVPSVPARPPRRIHKVPPVDAEVPLLPSKLSAVTTPVEVTQASLIEARKGPALPERAKPDIPPRPANPIARDSTESIPLSRVESTKSTGSGVTESEIQTMKSPPPAPKPKPAVPSRPAGNKIAALKAGFMSDLDKRLQLGPQGPTKPQEKSLDETEREEEKAPLADARKGRARGPARRKPVAPSTTAESSCAGAEDQQKATGARNWTIQEPWAVWQSAEGGAISIAPTQFSASSGAGETPLRAYSKSIQDSTSTMATETAQQLAAKGTASAASLAKTAVISQAPISLDQATATKDAEATATRSETMAEASNSDDVLNTPASSSSTHEPPASSANATSQTGEQSIKANVGTDAEEQMTAIVGGEAHGIGRDVLVRESANKE